MKIATTYTVEVFTETASRTATDKFTSPHSIPVIEHTNGNLHVTGESPNPDDIGEYRTGTTYALGAWLRVEKTTFQEEGNES